MWSQWEAVDVAWRLAVCAITTVAEPSGQNVAQADEDHRRNMQNRPQEMGEKGSQIKRNPTDRSVEEAYC